ncbi:MAG: hypothetical protein AMXMBFR53_31070 [Gemmatimonadota bacterium]
MSSRLDAALRHPALPALTGAGLVAAMALLAGRYWIPLDDGTLAQSAERVLAGELPHRDFRDPYTGLNAVLGALGFKLFGVRLAVLRVPLAAGFALWLPAVWLLARRFLAPGAAVVAALLAVVLSVPAYPAAMPTWFGLYAVTWGAWALLRWMEGGSRGWLPFVGVAAGVALLFKVVGLYFLAAALLAVAWRRADGDRVYAALVGVGVLAFLALLGRLVLPGSGAAGTYHFFLPALALGVALVVRSRPRTERGPDRDVAMDVGVRPILPDVGALLLGFLAPVAVFLVPYALSGALGAWFEGVFLLPGRRFQAAASPPGPAWTVVPGLAAVALAAGAARLSPVAERRATVAAAAGLAALLALDDHLDGAAMAALWYSLRGWIPALAFVGAAFLVKEGGSAPPDRPLPRRDGGPLFALLAAAALWGLVQFPYAAPAYFFYVAPLGVVATAACVRRGLLRAGPMLGLLAGVYLFLGAGYAAGVAATGTRALPGERGGIFVSEADAALYGRLMGLVTEHRGEGGLWAGPDAPEVWFLAGAPNPTPTLYEFLDPSPPSADGLATLFRENDVQVVVVNTRPLFSAPLGPDVLERVLATFPDGESVGPFLVRWRAR